MSGTITSIVAVASEWHKETLGMKRTKAAFASAALLCGVLAGWGGDALGGHPFVTEDAETQGKGNVEVEFNLDRQHGADGTKTTSPGNSVTMGISPKIDLAVVYSYDFTKANDGTKSREMSPVVATLKTAFLEGRHGFPTLGVKAGFSLPAAEGEQTALLATAVAEWSARAANGPRQRGGRRRNAPGGERRKNHFDPGERGRPL